MGREIQKRDKTLRESEECFRLTSDSMKDALVLLTDNGEIIFWNKAAEHIFGYKADEAMGRVLLDFLVPERYRTEIAQGLKEFVRLFRVFRG